MATSLWDRHKNALTWGKSKLNGMIAAASSNAKLGKCTYTKALHVVFNTIKRHHFFIIFLTTLQEIRRALSQQPCRKLIASPKRRLVYDGMLSVIGELKSSFSVCTNVDSFFKKSIRNLDVIIYNSLAMLKSSVLIFHRTARSPRGNIRHAFRWHADFY